MKKKLLIAVILALYIAAFILPTSASAGDNFKFSGNSVDAFFETFDESGCVGTFVFVFANKGKFQSPPGPGSTSGFAEIFIDQFDFCSETSLLSASGGISLDNGAFQIDRSLTSASLNTTIRVFDFISGTEFDVNIDLAWVGVGDLSRSTFHSHFKSPGCAINERFRGSFRSAQASGTVFDGGTNFTPNPTDAAGLFSTSNGTLFIGCN